jgi:hypothetical protein
MDMGTTHGVPGCEGGHAVNVSRRRPVGLAWSQEATGNGSVSGQADIADGHVSIPQGLSYRCIALDTWREGRSPPGVIGARRHVGCPMASRLGVAACKQ